MVFYDKEGKTYTYKTSRNNFIGKGVTAHVYKVSDKKCIKVYRDDKYSYFDEKMFNLFNYLFINELFALCICLYVAPPSGKGIVSTYSTLQRYNEYPNWSKNTC